MYQKLIYVILIIHLFAGCKRNTAPVIHEIDCQSESDKPGSVFQLKVNAMDPELDSLVYLWTADGGKFIEPIDQSKTYWLSPQDGFGDSYQITVSVSDGEFTVVDSCQVVLLDNNPPVIEEISALPSEIAGGSVVTLAVLATDAEGDPLTYQWYCPQGDFQGFTNGALVKWISPHSHDSKNYRIIIKVSDYRDTIQGQKEIFVLPSPPGSLQGKVFFLNTKIPVSGASLKVDDRTVTSDPDGAYVLNDLPFGEYSLEIQKEGFEPIAQAIQIYPDRISVWNVEMKTSVYTCQIHGIVKPQDGEMIAGATINLLNPDGSLSEVRCLSDLHGEYVLDGIPFGVREFSIYKDRDEFFSYTPQVISLDIQTTSFRKDFEMERKSVIPIVSTDSVTEVSYAYARAYGNISYTGDTTIAEKGFCWSLASGPTILDQHVAVSEDFLEFSGDLTALESGENYYLRAYVTNSWGKTSYGGEIQVETKNYGSFQDKRDGKTYKTVQIGDQTWMAENLNFVSSSGSWCYNDNMDNCLKYGRLYDWNTAKSYLGQGKDICPDGWTLPSDEDWQKLEQVFGLTATESNSYSYRGSEINLANKMKSVSLWHYSMNGINNLGVDIKPAGVRNSRGDYSELGILSRIWTSTQETQNQALMRSIGVYDNGVFRGAASMGNGYSVRCVKR